jgi:hypothetical protein
MSNRYLTKISESYEVVGPDEAIEAMKESPNSFFRRGYSEISDYRKNPRVQYRVQAGYNQESGPRLSVKQLPTALEKYSPYFHGLPASRSEASRLIDAAKHNHVPESALTGSAIVGGIGAIPGLLGLGAGRRAGQAASVALLGGLGGAAIGGLFGAAVGSGRNSVSADEREKALLYLRALELREKSTKPQT